MSKTASAGPSTDDLNDDLTDDLAEYALRLGDDALITAQRLVEWSARAPEMEEDIALANIALDQLGVARLMLSLAATLRGGASAGLDEDALAYHRDDREFRNCLLVELPNAGPLAEPGDWPDFAMTMARLLFLSAYQLHLYESLASSTVPQFAEIAAKAVKESRYHLDHATMWTLRLGDGTEVSRARMQAAVDQLWPYTAELLADDELTARLAATGAAPRPTEIAPQWLVSVGSALTAATLDVPPAPTLAQVGGWPPAGGRSGRHTEHLSQLLAPMQVLARANPGAKW